MVCRIVTLAMLVAWAIGAATVNWTNNAVPSGYTSGDTIQLWGTFTNGITITNSGAEGSPITVQFQDGCSFSNATLAANSTWIQIGTNGWIIIDGRNVGVIQLTDNGTVVANGGSKTYGAAGIGAVSATSGSHISILNLRIKNLYARESISEAIQGAGDGYGIYANGCSDLTVSNCFIEGCQNSVSTVYGATLTSNICVVRCVFSNYNHAVKLGSGGVATPVFNNLFVISNRFESGDMFESPNGVDLGLHRNPVFVFNESPGRDGCISNMVVSHNYIKHGVNPQSSVAGTAAVFCNLYNNDMLKRLRVFNNISLLQPPLSWSGGGGAISGSGTDVLVANNTIYGWQINGVWGGSEISVGGTNAYLFNNICISKSGSSISTYADCAGLEVTSANRLMLLSGVWSDYNVFNNQGANSFSTVVFIFQNGGTWNQGVVDTFAQWTNIWAGTLHDHCDPNSITNSVTLNADYKPLTQIAGTNLTAWGITDDFAGNPRPASGAWTVGAYEYIDLAEIPKSVGTLRVDNLKNL